MYYIIKINVIILLHLQGDKSREKIAKLAALLPNFAPSHIYLICTRKLIKQWKSNLYVVI